MAYSKIAFDFKDPNEVLDYELDWSKRLGSGDTISTSTWTAVADNDDAELSIDSDSHTDSTTTAWLSGGTEAVAYEITNRVVTAGGRTMDQTCKIRVKSK